LTWLTGIHSIAIVLNPKSHVSASPLTANMDGTIAIDMFPNVLKEEVKDLQSYARINDDG
jgi:hypothetical protein